MTLGKDGGHWGINEVRKWWKDRMSPCHTWTVTGVSWDPNTAWIVANVEPSTTSPDCKKSPVQYPHVSLVKIVRRNRVNVTKKFADAVIQDAAEALQGKEITFWEPETHRDLKQN